ncbi:Gfo/Idh/MocA family protein [Alkalicoccus halolimnae]|uniref:Gfo/Idh/MocA family oxidoreductase n=1 Tax=Alkalicoccus halolimnae TaxID=1667239 RepID=A0A5C7F510_9BACI|nr:Gfo/Idh/MocA family oxidoreductase [Alkalicoccus halolimnae]TXF83907.1 Gfo/Idh/MocA family oxidoreductase [Alkalicoccus halolimnae]
MNRLRIGIIGAGGIARERHIPVLLELKHEAEVTAVCDINIETAKQAGVSFPQPLITSDYNEVFEHVDAVIICTPNKFHADISIAALQAGVHVFCEKPMAMSAQEAEAMIDASVQSEKELMIAYHYRSMKESQAAKRLIDQQEIGTPMVARVQALRRRKVPGWGVFTNKELQGGGALIDFGCHFLDLSLWLLGSPNPVEVTGNTYNKLSKMPGQVNQWGLVDNESFDVDDHVTAYIRFDNGATMLFETSWAANVKDDKEYVSISGDTGGVDLFPLELNQAKHGMLLDSFTNWVPGEEDPGQFQMQNFFDACRGEAELIVSPVQAMQVQKIVDAIYESSETGRSVRL